MFNFNSKILALSKKVEKEVELIFKKIENIKKFNEKKVLKAFIDQKVSSSHFYSTNGYGYDDTGRECLDRVFAQIFETEDALVRCNFTSGTHALTVALFGVLRPNDKMLSISGKPYETLKEAINSQSDFGSLKDFGIKYQELNLKNDGSFDLENIKKELKKNIKVIYVQRSKGYSLRPSILSKNFEKLSTLVKKESPETIIVCDNCYCEFTEKYEPSTYGVDLTVGSLIKNPGGGIASCGGYIVGKKKLIRKCAYRLTIPGIGKEIGATLGMNREIFMGIFNAPMIVAEAMKTAVFSSNLFFLLSFEVYPKPNEDRSDIVQAIKFKNKELLLNFCQGIQKCSPVDSFLKPEPWKMPGYDHDIIMAAGTFTNGSSIELSADAPIRNPFTVFVQGSLNYTSGKLGILSAANEIVKLKNGEKCLTN